MYVRLVQFSFGAGSLSKAQELAADLGPAIREQHGCKGVTFFGDETGGDYGLFVLWETKDDADAAAPVIGPRLQHRLAGNVTGPPSITLYAVIDS